MARQRRHERAGRLALLPGAGGGQPADAALSRRPASPRPPGTFPRQDRDGGLCLTDYVLPGDHVAPLRDHGGGRRARAGGGVEAPGRVPEEPRLRRAGPGDRRSRRRVPPRPAARRLGLPRPDRTWPLEDKLSARYRGKRYSFGYPACPDLAFQRELFQALRPEEIGVELTEGDMMDPEASVSALVFHHPDARYFGV